MKEYNWRQERKKYSVDFQSSKETDTPAAAAPELPAPQPSSRKWLILGGIGILLIAALITAGVYLFKKEDSATMLAKAADKQKEAVGVVTMTVEFKNGNKETYPIGTAWAFAEDKFATNAHVAYGLQELRKNIIGRWQAVILTEWAKEAGCKSIDEFLKKSGNNAEAILEKSLNIVNSQIANIRVDIIINGSQKKSYSVTHVQTHKDYATRGSKIDPDVAVLTIQGKHNNFFKLADNKTLTNLKPGTPIAFLGFPMENLVKNNLNLDNPIASMQTGSIVAISNFELKDSGSTGNFLLRHNLPATGGASGSPIFTQDGEVIALLCGGNIIGQASADNRVTRAPSAAQINFAIRVDLLNGVGSPVEINKFLGL